jgi:hypothetical protein
MGYRHYGIIRHVLLFRYLLSFCRWGYFILIIISEILRPRITDGMVQLGRRKGRKL